MNDKFLVLFFVLLGLAIASGVYFSSSDNILSSKEGTKSFSQLKSENNEQVKKKIFDFSFDISKVFPKEKASNEIDDQDIALRQSLKKNVNVDPSITRMLYMPNGLILINRFGKVALMDRNKKYIVPLLYDNVKIHNDYYLFEQINSNNQFYSMLVDKYGNIMLKGTGKIFVVRKYIIIKNNNIYDIYTRNYEKLFQVYSEMFPRVNSSLENTFIVKENGKELLVNIKGEYILSSFDEKKNIQMKNNLRDKETLRFTCPNDFLCSVSSEGLTVKMGRAGAYSTALANKYYNRGKYYFEAKIQLAGDSERVHMIHSDIGIISPNSQNNRCTLLRSNEEKGCFSYGLERIIGREKNKLKDNDVVGFAVDFDNGYIQLFINGRKVEGENQLFKFNNKYSYTICAHASHSMNWVVNFGKTPFRYNVPYGYLPFYGK